MRRACRRCSSPPRRWSPRSRRRRRPAPAGRAAACPTWAAWAETWTSSPTPREIHGGPSRARRAARVSPLAVRAERRRLAEEPALAELDAERVEHPQLLERVEPLADDPGVEIA